MLTPEAMITDFFVGFSILGLVASLVSLAASVFLGLAVYYDAKSWNSDSAVMWGLLCGILGFIPAIIYLVIRSSSKSQIKCPRCRNKLPVGTQICYICQTPIQQMVQPSEAETLLYKKRAKLFLILMIVFNVLLIISIVMMFVFMFTNVMKNIPDLSMYY